MIFSKKCPLCGGELSQRLPYLNKEYPTATELKGLTIVICKNCGLGMAIPERSWQVMENFYRRLYRAPGSVHRHTALPLLNEWSISTRALSQWMLLKTFRPFGPENAFCDIGPGGGATFQTAKFLGLNMKMFAYEPDEFSVELLTKQDVSVFAESFHPHIKLPSIKFSAIVMSHLLEHFCVSDTLFVLKKVKEMLLNDGILLIEVPNTPMASFGKMRLNDSPHLTFWTTTSLAKAMRLAGMHVLFISTAGEKKLDWWKRVQETKQEIKPRRKDSFRRVKALAKRILPHRLLAVLSTAVKGPIRPKSTYEYLSSWDFQYGQDRVCIRAIGRPTSVKT